MSAMHVEHISVFINRSPAEVYAFASDPHNLSRWAAGLARSELRQQGDEWIADSPMGQVAIRFVPDNPYGVLDHDVTLESGVRVHNLPSRPCRPAMSHPSSHRSQRPVAALAAPSERALVTSLKLDALTRLEEALGQRLERVKREMAFLF